MIYQQGNHQNKITIDVANKMLSHIDADCDRSQWVSICSALYDEFGDAGKGLAEDWSKTSSKFKQKDFNSMWRSLRPGKCHIGTLVHHALAGGYRFENNRENNHQKNNKSKLRVVSSSSPNPANKAPEQPPAPDETKEINPEHVKAFTDEWQQGIVAEQHEYLTHKGVNNHGWKISKSGALLVPCYCKNGSLIGLQRIYKNSDGQFIKQFATGSKIEMGAFSVIHGDDNRQNNILIAEGVATGASVYEATGLTTVIAFNVGNLSKVVDIFRKKHPGANIVICADNDRKNRGANVGMEAARKLCKYENVYHVAPEYEAKTGGKLDFNDLHQREGLRAVKRLIMRKLKAINGGKCVDLVYKKILRGDQYPDWTESPKKGKKQAMATLANFEFLMNRLGVRLAHNTDKYEIESNIYHEDDSKDDIITVLRTACLANELKLNIEDVFRYMNWLATQNPYSPMKNYILSEPWDGVDRLPDICKTIPIELSDSAAENEKRLYLKDFMIEKWLLQVVYSVFSQKPQQFRYVLTLSGEQSVGKSLWFESLFKQVDDYFYGGFILKVGNKDSEIQVTNHGVIELAEIDATFKKSEQAQLKAFITSKYDDIRKPYGRDSKKYKRNTVFCATVNDHEFLRDPSGSSRFWVININRRPGIKIDFEHGIDMQQVFAQLYEQHYCKGVSFRPTLEQEQLIAASNESNTVVSPMEQLLLETFSPHYPDRKERKNVTQILIDCGYARDRITKRDTNEMGNLLRKHGFQIALKMSKLYAMPKVHLEQIKKGF